MKGLFTSFLVNDHGEKRKTRGFQDTTIISSVNEFLFFLNSSVRPHDPPERKSLFTYLKTQTREKKPTACPNVSLFFFCLIQSQTKHKEFEQLPFPSVGYLLFWTFSFLGIVAELKRFFLSGVGQTAVCPISDR